MKNYYYLIVILLILCFNAYPINAQQTKVEKIQIVVLFQKCFIQIIPSIDQLCDHNMKQIDTSSLRYGMYGGDVNQAGVVDGSDGGLIDNDVFNFITGC